MNTHEIEKLNRLRELISELYEVAPNARKIEYYHRKNRYEEVVSLGKEVSPEVRDKVSYIRFICEELNLAFSEENVFLKKTKALMLLSFILAKLVLHRY